MMFRQQQRPAYYKRLHRYVHKRFRRKRSLLAWQALFSGTGERAPLRTLLSSVYYLPAAAIDQRRLARLTT
jgi:anaerobic magnesium-protoporphyrin IX monomethyl ester cyclase